MSFDIIIATRRPPTRSMVEAHLKEARWRLTLEGDLAGDAANLVAESRGLLRRKHIFVLSGPYPAEREDLQGTSDAAAVEIARCASCCVQRNLGARSLVLSGRETREA